MKIHKLKPNWTNTSVCGRTGNRDELKCTTVDKEVTCKKCKQVPRNVVKEKE